MNQTLHTFLHRPIYEFNTATAVKPVVSTHIYVHTPSPSIHLLSSDHILFLTPSIHLLSLCSFATLLCRYLSISQTHPSILLASPLCPSNASLSLALFFVLYTHPLSLSPSAKFFIEL